ncbi:MAG: aminotransferase class III-fold pyridoxal phosphate-dependent enzyme [Holophagaceae bacterium]|uniref:Aminotransferase class III-fold pyridoxal phosphate-dependent enzyme n=1 Tax=Candidatus Geothrix skivensis TaxID=2954439 RepID=A0A9D7XFE6_9BACT|nr:aminotransferase class III-fold pyridoxal phosphate-dependent enzyme [Candidatus Geothrix skivensis]
MVTAPTVPALLPTYAPYPFPLVRGEGDRVFDDQGQAWWDFYGGHCVCATGHSHPALVKAVADQAASLLFYSAAAALPVRDQAAAQITAFAGMDSVFFCNSGAEANENALKVALLLTGRKKLGAFQGGWHGRTLLALSVTDDPKITEPFAEHLVPTLRLPFGDLAALAAADFSDLAGVILEPIQSMAGIKTASAEWFRALRAKCDASGTLLIFDEIQTGMGRMGTPFAAQFYRVRPDLITSAKGLASGVPMGALLMTSAVASQLKGGDLGSTFGGGPLACAALLATVEVIESEKLMAHATGAAARLRKELMESVVTEVLGEGLLLGLRSAHAAALKKHLLAQNILVGGSGDPTVLRLMPPLNVSDQALRALISAIHAFTPEQP